MNAGRMTRDSERSCRIRRHEISWRSGISAWHVDVGLKLGVGDGGMVDKRRRVLVARLWIVRWSASITCVNVYDGGGLSDVVLDIEFWLYECDFAESSSLLSSTMFVSVCVSTTQLWFREIYRATLMEAVLIEMPSNARRAAQLYWPTHGGHFISGETLRLQ